VSPPDQTQDAPQAASPAQPAAPTGATVWPPAPQPAAPAAVEQPAPVDGPAWPAPGAVPLYEQAAQNALATESKPGAGDGDPGDAVVNHNQPTLTFGSAGPDVLELVRLLKNLGYATNTVAAGTNFQNVLDGSVMTDVRRFCADHDVANDPAEFIGREQPPEVYQNTHVGPYIWEALYRLQPKS
jgi:hypothetical protein